MVIFLDRLEISSYLYSVFPGCLNIVPCPHHKVIRSCILCTFLAVSLSWFSRANPKAYSSEPSPGFIENKGQIIDQDNKPNPACLFLLNMPGMKVHLRKGGFSYDLYRISNNEPRISNIEFPSSIPACLRQSGRQHQVSSIKFHRIDLDLLWTNPEL